MKILKEYGALLITNLIKEEKVISNYPSPKVTDGQMFKHNQHCFNLIHTDSKVKFIIKKGPDSQRDFGTFVNCPQKI